MFAYFKGILASKKEGSIIVETGGVGYLINYPAGLMDALPGRGEDVTVYTYTSVSQDAVALYGFPTEDDLDLFRLLISVSGVGPKAGMALLSVLRPAELRAAIVSGDTKKLSKAKGVSDKTAQRIIVDLKNKDEIKAGLEGDVNDLLSADGSTDIKEGTAAYDALDALQMLGYGKRESEKALNAVLLKAGEDASSDELLKAALKKLL